MQESLDYPTMPVLRRALSLKAHSFQIYCSVIVLISTKQFSTSNQVYPLYANVDLISWLSGSLSLFLGRTETLLFSFHRHPFQPSSYLTNETRNQLCVVSTV